MCSHLAVSTEKDDNDLMQINSFSDYSLRILMFLAVAGEKRVTAREIAGAYGLSFDHVSKAAQLLTRNGYVEATRGRGGGMRLAKKPEHISLGAILRLTEAGTGLVECMRPGPTSCILAMQCGLKVHLREASEAFFSTLDERTLADALPKPKQLQKTLGLMEA